MIPTVLASIPNSYVMLEGAANGGMSSAQASSLANSLQTFGGTLLDNFISLVPALAALAAIGFVVALVRKKVKA